jgi:hypothetical protein
MNIKIELSEREVYALTVCHIGQTGRRKLFGAVGLTNKIYEQLSNQIGEGGIEKLKKEWKGLPVQESLPVLCSNCKKPIVKNKAPQTKQRTAQTEPYRGTTRVWRA